MSVIKTYDIPSESWYKIRVTVYEIYCKDTIPHIPFIFDTNGKNIVITEEHKLTYDQFQKENIEILSLLAMLKENINNLDEKQITYVELIDKLNNLKNVFTLTQQNYLRSINMCIDTLKNTRSEIITKQQIEAIETVIKLIHINATNFEVNSMQNILINSGLNPLPNLNGIAELYIEE